MKLLQSILVTCSVCCFATTFTRSLLAEESESARFQAILEVAEINLSNLSQASDAEDYRETDWQILLQIFSRLEQFGHPKVTTHSAKSLSASKITERQSRLGEIIHLQGEIVATEAISLPTNLSNLPTSTTIYRCLFQFPNAQETSVDQATILTSKLPKAWLTKDVIKEPVQIRGVVVQFSKLNNQPTILTNHIAWSPTERASLGHLLLARCGMDVALLEEIRHRQPFVKPEISREGEAFYAALTAMGKADLEEIASLANQQLRAVAEKWRQQQPELARNHRELEGQLAKTTEGDARQNLKRRIKQAKNQRGLAATVLKQAELGQSSVAPMFLQPEQEVGELFVFAGTARRAVRIAVDADTKVTSDLTSYYEVEVFPAESPLLNNQPIVCCVRELPSGFPTGDEIREPVRIAGVFFKSWRYRSRNLQSIAGQTNRQRQLYTPVLVGKVPTWLTKTASGESGWSLVGGIAFLVGLVTLCMALVWLARRDRLARAALRPRHTIDL